MDIKNSLIRQVNENFPKVWASPHFTSDRMWLTFYLCGLEAPLERIENLLAMAGWQTSGGADGGWIYPVVEVDQTVDAVIETALWVQRFCERHTLIDLIDADTIPNNRQSRIITLYRTEVDSFTFSS